MAGGGQVGAAIAVYAKTKNKALRKTIASALPVGLMGVGEPLIYGVTLPLGKPFIGACIGGAFGGAVQAAYMVGAATIGISGLPLAASTDNIPMYLLGLVTAYVPASLQPGSWVSTTRRRVNKWKRVFPSIPAWEGRSKKKRPASNGPLPWG